MDGFLTLEQAAEQLQFSVSELSRQIDEGRVVAIIKEGRSWLSVGEVSRLKRQSERGARQSEPVEELRLLRRSTTETHRADPLPVVPLSEPSALEPPVPVNPPLPPVMPAEPVQPDTEVPRLPLEDNPMLAPLAPRLESLLPAVPLAPSLPTLPPKEREPAPPSPPIEVPLTNASEDKLAQQVRELNRRCAELEARNQELEAVTARLKTGLQETEATLRRHRTTRANLENEVLGLQDHLTKARTRIEALEREVQHLSSEMEKAELAHHSELRRLRGSKADRNQEPTDHAGSGASLPPAELEALRNQMAEKDRLLAQEYEQRATLRSQLEDKQQKYFELKARYDKEKAEWSELLAQSLQSQTQMREQLEEVKTRHPKGGWNPFRREK